MADTKIKSEGDQGSNRRRKLQKDARIDGAGGVSSSQRTGNRRKARPRTKTTGPRRTTGGAAAPDPLERQLNIQPGETIQPDASGISADTGAAGGVNQPEAQAKPAIKSGSPPIPTGAPQVPISGRPPMPSKEHLTQPQPPPPTAGDLRTGIPGYTYDNEANDARGYSPQGRAAKKEAEAGKKDGQATALNGKEKEKIDNKIDDALNTYDEKRKKNKDKERRGYFKSTRSKVTLAAGAIGATASIVAAVAFLPTWALNQMHAKVQDALMDRVDYAMRETANKIMERYFRDQIFPSLDACPDRQITNACYVSDPGDGPLRNLYQKFRQSRMDQKLLDRHGITVENNNGEIEIRKHGESQGVFGRRTAGTRGVANAVIDTTGWKGVKDRWQLRHAINTKYAGKWCMFLCEERDHLADRFSPLRRLKLRMAVRISAKADARVGAFFICAITNCSKDALENETRQSVKRALKGIDNDLLIEVGERLQGRRLTEAVTRDVIDRIGAEKVVNDILQRIGVKATSKGASRLVPIAGWVLFALDLALALDYIDAAVEDRKFSEFLYEKNVGAYIDFASGLTVCKDETQSLLPLLIGTERRKATLFEKAACFQYVAGFASSRIWQASNGVTPKSTITCPQPTKLEVQFESDEVNFDDFFNGLFDVVRVPDESKERVVLRGEDAPLVCPDKFARKAVILEDIRNNRLLDLVLTISMPIKFCLDLNPTDECTGDSPSRISNRLRSVVNGVDTVVGGVLGAGLGVIRTLLSFIPGVGTFISYLEMEGAEATEAVTNKMISLFGAFTDTLFPPAVNALSESGSEILDQFAGGWNFISELFMDATEDEDAPGTYLGLQGRAKVSEEERAELDLAIQQGKRFDIENKSIIARYFDLSDHTSLASTTLLNVASSLPVNGKPLGFSLNPSGAFSNIGSLLGFSAKASAQAGPASGLPVNRSSLFGSPEYVYTVADLENLNIDDMTPEYAAEQQTLRDESLVEINITDPHTGRDFPVMVAELANNAALFNTTEQSMTKVLDTDSEEDVNNYYNTVIDGRDGGGATSGPGLGDPGNCAPGTTLIPDNPFLTHIGTIKTICNAGGVQVAAEISGNVLALMTQIRADTGLNVGGWGFRSYDRQITLRRRHCGLGNYNIFVRPSGQCSPQTARPGSSQHEQGLAIDFHIGGNSINGTVFNWLRNNAAEYGLRNLPSERWHWSTTGR